MSSRWLRGIVFDYSAGVASLTNTSFWQKAYTLWLRYVMDFTFQSENCGAGRSWVSTEKNGTAGAFAGSTYEFTDSSAPFVIGDQGKYLIINDNTHPVNAGIYRIIKYVSSTTIVINFACGYGEYPVAASGLSWWICGTTYQIPTDGEYVRLQSRHSSGWAIECARGAWAYYALCFRIAVTGNWSGKTIGNFSGDILGDSRSYNGLCTSFGNGSGRQTFWAEGDYDGEWLHIWKHSTDNGGWGQDNAVILMSVEFVTPVEEGHTDDELIVFRGRSVLPGAYDGGHREYNGDRARGRSWSDLLGGEVTGYCLDYTLSGISNNFARWTNIPTGREKNFRRDGRIEAFRGTFYVIDENNYNGLYQVLGYLNGHWTIPMFPQFITAGLRYDYYNYDSIKMIPLDMNGDRDVICLLDGIVVPWCGLSIMDQGQ